MSVLSPGSANHYRIRNKPHFVYQFWDNKGRCLYVGMTASPSGRIATHSSTAPWWRYVDHFSAEVHPDRETALDEETRLIQELQPLWNFSKAEISVGSRSGHGHGGVAFTKADVQT